MLFKQKIISTYFCRFSPSFHLASMIVVTSSIQESRGARDLKRFFYENCKNATQKYTRARRRGTWEYFDTKIQKRNTKYKSIEEGPKKICWHNTQYAIQDAKIQERQNTWIPNTKYKIWTLKYKVQKTKDKTFYISHLLATLRYCSTEWANTLRPRGIWPMRASYEVSKLTPGIRRNLKTHITEI